MNMKEIFFDGKMYLVPSWVNWVGRNTDGTIVGYQYEPFPLNDRLGYYNDYGHSCMIYSPRRERMLQRV